jgi:DNA-binding NarL/FixJ family response regulator
VAFDGARDGTVKVLLVSAHDWFASALQAVLEPEGFVFSRVRSARVALRDAAQIDPDIVIIDEGLPDLDAPTLSSALTAGPLKSSVPMLVYSPNFWQESAQAAAMSAGAWDIIKEPVRSRLIVAKLRRLLEIKALIETTEEGSLSDMETGLFNVSGLLRMLKILGATARRTQECLSCVVLGPTSPVSAMTPEERRRRTASLCVENARASDAIGWIDDTNVGIIAFGTTAAGLTALAGRLSEKAVEEGLGTGLSAGVVEIPVAAHAESSIQDRTQSPVVDRVAGLSRFVAAQQALREAREAGGGIRIADGS